MIVGLSVVVTVLVLQFHHHDPHGGKMPKWVCAIIFKCTIYAIYKHWQMQVKVLFIRPFLSFSRFESSSLTGAHGFSAWRSLERKTKQQWAAPAPRGPTSTPTRPHTTPAPAAFRWAPYQGRRPPSQPRPTGTWIYTSVTTRWAQTTPLSRRAPRPPRTTSTQSRRGRLCCWSRFRKLPRS